MEANTNERKKVCPRYDAVFACYSANCWCNQLASIMPLSMNEDCLCPECLKIAIDNKIKANV